MKKANKYFCIIIITLLPIFSYSQNSPNQQLPSKLEQLWTINQVKDMSKKYNLQDSVVLKRYSFLLYTSKENMEKYFHREAKAIQLNAEFSAYLSKTKYVRNHDDYEKLLNFFPNVKTDIVKSYGGEQGFNEYVKEARKYKWRIYRNPKGGLGFWRSDTNITQEELKFGKRVDNLPKI